MKAAPFNAAVAKLSRNQHLGGLKRAAGGADMRHKWTVRARRIEPYTGTWRVSVGTGCINDLPASIMYRREGDPRGWEMPAGYPAFASARKAFGATYPFVDRPMWDTPRPFLLLTAPEDGGDLGGFTPTPDVRRPKFFRTAERWEQELYHASVWVSTTFWRADPSFDLLRITEATRTLRRFRVFAGRLPPTASGVLGGDAKELAKLFLLRTPGKPQLDQLHVQQLTFWNLRARTVEPTFGFGEALAQTGEAVDLALLGLGLTGITAAEGLLGIQAALTEIFVENIDDILASASTIEFWSV